MEQIVRHEYFDVYRVTDGVLLNVKKYATPRCSFYWNDFDKNKKSFTKLSGLKNLYIANKDVEYGYNKEVLLKGSLIYGNDYIVPLINPYEYRFEIKTTGECFAGNYVDITNYLDIIRDMIDEYLNDYKKVV